MTNNHVLTKDVGNLRGFSTDSIYLRPSNVADIALNMQHFPDDTFGPRRGYQFLVESKGGLGTSSYDDPVTGEIETVTIDFDGNLYIKHKAFLYLTFVPPTANEYLSFSIITDPAYLTSNPFGAGSPGSITVKVERVFAAVVNGTQAGVNVIAVDPGFTLNPGDVVTFYDSNQVLQTKTISATGVGTITVLAPAVSVTDNTIITQLYKDPFGNGSDPYTINNFLFNLVASVPGTGFTGDLINTNYQAAFIEIVEPTIILSGITVTIPYFYWEQVNRTLPITFTACADPAFQNSEDFQVASFANFDDILYIANGINEVQKFDGQEVYRAGMPRGINPIILADNLVSPILPFLAAQVYKYQITYTQLDTVGHIVEGERSETYTHTVAVGPAAIDVTVNDIEAGTGWNTNCAIAVGGITTVYGPDVNGFWYDNAALSANTLQIADNAYYSDSTAARTTAATVNVFVLPVAPDHNINVGDIVFFVDVTNVLRRRVVTETTLTSITIAGTAVSVANLTNIRINDNSLVYGNLAIVNGTQIGVITVIVFVGHTIQINDVVTFVDSFGLTQVRTATNITANSIDVFPPVDVDNRLLLASDTLSPNNINLRRGNAKAATLTATAPISNNLRINIYRTATGLVELNLVDAIPNNSFSFGQLFTDQLSDVERGVAYLAINDPDNAPTPPPISKYLTSLANVMIYAGGKSGERENQDNVYYSQPSNPPSKYGAEYVPLATNVFNVATADDDVTGVGVSGTSLVIFKNKNIFSISGSLSTNQFEVIPVAPGSNIGCVSHSSIQSVGSLLYFLHTNGVYAMSENQFFPTDPFGNPVPISSAIEDVFRSTPFLPQNKYVFKRSIGCNYVKDNQYLLFLPCEDMNAECHVANQNSIILCYDYQGKNWLTWDNINAAGGMFTIGDDLYFHERKSASLNTEALLAKQHRFYRQIDYADHTQAQKITWKSSWEDLQMPQVRKKFNHAMFYMDRSSQLDQFNDPMILFTTYLDRIPGNAHTIAAITTVNNIRNAGWSFTPWAWNFWSGYQDSFIRINLKGGTVAKSIQLGLYMNKLNSSFKLAGFQLEAIPENRKGFVR